MNKMPVKRSPNKKVALEQFLKLVKAGKYATIERSSIQYARTIEERSEIKVAETEEYYYSMS
jgi:hypothetical protein